MLSDFEKKEMREDAGSHVRRDIFRKMEKSNLSAGLSMDSYLRFLKSVEKVFSSFVSSPRKTVTRISRL
jgi:hypothetical protein